MAKENGRLQALEAISPPEPIASAEKEPLQSINVYRTSGSWSGSARVSGGLGAGARKREASERRTRRLFPKL